MAEQPDTRNRDVLSDQDASAVMEAWQDHGISERNTLLAAERVMADERTQLERLRKDNERLREEIDVALGLAEEGGSCEAARVLRQALKSRGASDDIGASDA